MTAAELEQCRQRLGSRIPILGSWLRRRAARSLAKDLAPEAAAILATAVAGGVDSAILEIVSAALANATASAIEAVCQVWAATRNPQLEGWLRQWQWAVQNPVEVRLLANLKLGRGDDIAKEGPEVLEPLVNAMKDGDPEIARGARQGLAALKNQETIDALCQRWVDWREGELGRIISAAGYVAQAPPAARAWSALLAGRESLLEAADYVAPLLQAARGRDPGLAARAQQALSALRNPDAQDTLCRQAIDREDPVAREIAVAHRFAPRSSLDRALFYFLTEQWGEYEAVDFDHRLLGEAYATAPSRLRARLAAKARRSGRVDWISAITLHRHERRLVEMTEEEWDNTCFALQENAAWPELWRLAKAAPPKWSVRILYRLRQAGWRPSSESENQFQEQLNQLAEPLLRDGLECDPNHPELLPPPGLGCLARCQQVLAGHQDAIVCLAVAEDGATLASGGKDRTVFVWDVAVGRPRCQFPGHSDDVSSLAFGAHPGLLASASADHSVRLWQATQARPVERLVGHSAPIRCLQFAPNGSQLASGGEDHSVRLWSLAGNQAHLVLAGHRDVVSCLAMMARHRLVASGSYDHQVRLWRLADGRPAGVLTGHQALVGCLCASPDGTWLASGSKDRSILVWALPAGQQKFRLPGHRDDVSCLVATPDSRYLASGSWDDTIRIWDMSDGSLAALLGSTGTLDGHSGWVTCLALSPDGSVLASGSLDQTIRLWTVPDGRPLAVLEGHTERISALAFLADGALASSSWDGTVRVWRSELSRLGQHPVSLCTWDDLNLADQALRNAELNGRERQWLEFTAALMRRRRQYDIQIQEPSRLEAGEFDIEIEG